MRFDRGMIKWQPFDSVVSSKSVVKSLIKEKSKIEKPILSEEEMMEIEEKIIEAYYLQENVTVQIFKDGFLTTLTGKIKKIDHISKIVYLNSTRIFFRQIIHIK